MSRGKCPEPREDCRYKRPFSDNHHQYYPRAEYEAAGTIEARWRDLGKNCLQLCRCVHDDIHANDMPPEMPDREQMVDDLLTTDEHLTRKVRDALMAAVRARRGTLTDPA